MKDFIDTLVGVARWTWRHAGAGIALILIVLALIVGYRLGRPAAPAPAGELIADSDEPAWYTCSMHPTVRLQDPDAKCPICFMDLIPVADGATNDANPRRLAISESAAALSRIETMPVSRFMPTAEVRLYGKVTYDETSVARLTAYFPSRIDRLFVNYIGVPVKRGDHLAEVYSPELLGAFEELRQAKLAQIDVEGTSRLVREATRDTLIASREKLRLFGLTDEQIAAIEDGTFESDRLTIYTPIGGVVTHLGVREGDYVETGEPIATVADLDRLWLDLEAYESQLPMLRWGQPVRFTVEAHPGEVFDGRISFIEPMVDERTRTAAVRVAVDNTDRRLKPGMFASAIVRPRVGADGAVVSDELVGRWVSPMHPTIVKDGPGQCDICGMDLVPAETLGIVRVASDAGPPLVIPRSAVLFTGARSIVFVRDDAEEGPTYEARAVTLGPRAGAFYIVKDGLQEGESVVVNGAFRVDSAMQIAAKPSMMSPDGGQAAPGHAGHGMGETPPPSTTIPDHFVDGLAPVFDAYLTIQERLAADDFEGFVEAAPALKAAVDAVNTAGLIGEPLAVWRRASANLRPDPDVATVEQARIRFEDMSAGVIELQRVFGHAGDEMLHLAHCPMAFDFKGADWIQRGDVINNPYFGATMLRCGEIREDFPPQGDPDNHEGHDHD